MPTRSKSSKSKTRKQKRAVISNKVRDYGNDPFVIKKADASQKFLEKHGFPDVVKKSKA